MLKKLKEHVLVWLIWRKKSLNSPIYKLMVLVGVAKSPTFEHCKAWDRWTSKLGSFWDDLF